MKFREIVLLAAVVFFVTALCYSLASIHMSSVEFTVKAETAQTTSNYTYVLPNYIVNYAIVEMPPSFPITDSTYLYNIVVYGPPPFSIQISFNEQTIQNTTQKISVIMPTNAFSTLIGCTSYPTQIEMSQVGNESVSPSPTMSIPSASPSLTSSPYLTATSTLAPTESPTSSSPTQLPTFTPYPTSTLAQTSMESPTSTPSADLTASLTQQPANQNSSILNYILVGGMGVLIAALLGVTYVLIKRTKTCATTDQITP